MNNLEEIIMKLVSGCKITYPALPLGGYIYYWNGVILDNNGGLVDIIKILNCYSPSLFEEVIKL